MPRPSHFARARVPRAAAPVDPPANAARQLDLFPVKPVVERLDPRVVIGPRTAVADMVRVRLRPDDAPHLVFHDRHGWYCETHGPGCDAVRLARAGADE
jgi:hypothetical protein